MVKIAPHFYEHPYDLLWIPAYLCYAYWHSLVKMYCAVTFWDHSWGGRNLEAVGNASTKKPEKEDLEAQLAKRSEPVPGIADLYGDANKAGAEPPPLGSRCSSYDKACFEMPALGSCRPKRGNSGRKPSFVLGM